jgi:DNA-binding NarL/FixJ family response regulator
MEAQGTKHLTVLIVDDDVVFRELFAKIIAARFPQTQIFQAGDLAEARAYLGEHEPGVAFVDVSLPDGKGFALVRELRQAGSTATIAICTSYDILEYREAAEKCGATCFLAKSVLTPQQIEDVVALASPRTGRETPQ